jgi:hypothetical protein
MGTLNILEAIRNVDSVRAAVMDTTDKCYENNEWEWGYREMSKWAIMILIAAVKAVLNF